MDTEKIKSDFKKRFGADCEKIYFMGKPLIFMKNQRDILGCGVSVGGFIAVAKRADERICMQFSDSDRHLVVKRDEFHKFKDDKRVCCIEKLEKNGAKVGGAGIFFCNNAALPIPDAGLILQGAEAFCEKISDKLQRFSGCENELISAVGKKNYLTLYSERKVDYLPLPENRYKIILCHIKDKGVQDYTVDTARVNEAAECIKNGNYEGFGVFLSDNAEKIIEKNKLVATKKIFSVARKRKECIGAGALSEGGIFALVKNGDVDEFTGRVSEEYKSHFGGAPEFYITDTETGGQVP